MSDGVTAEPERVYSERAPAVRDELQRVLDDAASDGFGCPNCSRCYWFRTPHYQPEKEVQTRQCKVCGWTGPETEARPTEVPVERELLERVLTALP